MLQCTFNPSLSLSVYQDPPNYEVFPASGEDLRYQVTFEGKTTECNHTFEQQGAYSLFLYPDPDGIQCLRVDDEATKSQDGSPLLRSAARRRSASPQWSVC